MSVTDQDNPPVPDYVWRTDVTQEAFDPDFYLMHNEDVQAAGMDPWAHYVNYGGRESRDPAPWFSSLWYRAHVLTALDAQDHANPLDHWMQEGRQVGFSPSSAAEDDLIEQAQTEFDAVYYLEKNPDVAESGMDPWEHFTTFGWHEGRAPFAGFDTAFYQQQLADQDAPVVGRNPFLHWIAVGRDQGWPISGAPLDEGETEKLSTLVEHLSAQRMGLPEDDIALLAGAALFDPSYLAVQDARYEGLDRLAAARLYLEETNRAAALDPSPLFAARFYYHNYGHLVPSDQAMLVHYLRTGRDLGVPPSPEAAWSDVLRLRLDAASYPSMRKEYIDTMSHTPQRADVIEDYVLHGVATGSPLLPRIDEDFVRTVYGPLVPGGVGAPAAFVARNAHRCWVYPAADPMRFDAEQVRNCETFDPEFYTAQAGLAGSSVDPAEHYVTAGVYAGLQAGPDFDTMQYMVANPDVAAARIVPVVHFDTYGRGEGRAAFNQWIEVPEAAKKTPDPSRPTVLVLTHEASRTGAPIVALNIARALAETHNVITWTGKDGPLTKDFGEVSTRVLVDYGNSRNMEAALRAMQEAHGLEVAVVSSVVSGLTLPPLRLAGVPVISLIHEFADYVRPSGMISRMALYSDAAVFPAEIVRKACTREMAAFGFGAEPEMIHIRPQGYNVANSDAEVPLTPQDIYEVIDAPSDPRRRRIMFGAGWVQPRKGVDLFLQVASALKDDPDYDWRFIWVGGNYHPEADMVVSTYLAHQVREAGLTEQMTFMAEQPGLDPFWEVADVFFMSSRLDPYPNVALEALYRSVPVVCFQGATGIADLAQDYDFAVGTAPFADIEGATEQLRRLIRPDCKKALSGAPGDKMRQQLSFDAYVSDLVDMVSPAQARVAEVNEMTRRFEAVTPDDLALAARHIPPSLRLSPIIYPGILPRSLGEHAQRLGLSIDEETGALLGVSGQGVTHPSVRPWPAGGGMVQATGLAGKSELMIHVPDEAAFEVLKSILMMLPPTANLQVRVVAGLPWLVPQIKELIADLHAKADIGVEDRASLRAAQAVTRLAADEGPEYIAVICAQSEPGSALPEAPECGVLAALLSGAGESVLQAHPDCPAILGAMSLGHRSAATEACSDDSNPVYAPRFAGVYRRTALRDFAQSGLPSEAGGLSPMDRDSLASLRFLQDQGASGTAIMLPLLPAI